MTTTLDIAAVLPHLAEADRERAERYLRDLNAAVEAEYILNVDFNDIKFHLNRYVETAVKVAKDASMTRLGVRWLDLPKDVQTVCWGIMVLSAHDLISASKKLAKAKVSHPYLADIRVTVDALLPIAQTMAAVKPFIVKGRRPPTAEEQAERARKLALVDSMPRAQCGCCFATQAVLPNGTMHDHGYRKPRSWMKQGSCRGWGVLPLSVSADGPKLMVKLLNQAEASMHQGIAALRKATKLSVQRGHEMKNGIRVPKYQDIEVGHPDFERVRQSRIEDNEASIREIIQDRKVFEKVIAEWKPGYVYAV